MHCDSRGLIVASSFIDFTLVHNSDDFEIQHIPSIEFNAVNFVRD